jgi:hypothetical protein
MLVDELQIARARLARHSAIAQAVRRCSGLEWTGSGYRALAKTRRVRMQQQLARVPRGVGKFHVLWSDQDSCTIEWSDGERVFYATVSKIAVQRHMRQAGRRAEASGRR